ncbi:hypothetical protein ACHHYP_10294 [Achlya hypogyna]|uniref:Uncharacterized protein n=1 Tax=Achlya hypogyna TaxID=1202772 RepID=A0A1V9YLY4_ACHHY|nr:hypothetical protein ACHHYP_10294 [Achlya hypogyna]
MDALMTYAKSGRLPPLHAASMRKVRWHDVGRMDMTPEAIMKLGQTLLRIVRNPGDDAVDVVWVWACTLVAKSFLCAKTSTFSGWYCTFLQTAAALELPRTLVDFIDTGEMMRNVVVTLANFCSVTMKTKDAYSALCAKYDVNLDVLLASLELQPATERKMELCSIALEKDAITTQIGFFLKLVQRVKADPQWAPSLLKLLESRPAHCFILLGDISTALLAGKPVKVLRKLVLDCLAIVAGVYYRKELICQAMTMLLQDPDATLRLAALKVTMRLLRHRRDEIEFDLVRALVVVIVSDNAKSVVQVAMHELLTLIREMPAGADVHLPVEFFGHLIAKFILVKADVASCAWLDTLLNLLYDPRIPLNLNTLLTAFADADDHQQQQLVEQSIDGIVRSVAPFATSLDSARHLQQFLSHIEPPKDTLTLWTHELLRRYEAAISHYFEPSALPVLLLTVAWIHFIPANDVDKCAQSAVQVLHQLFGGDPPQSPHEKYVGGYALCLLRLANQKEAHLPVLEAMLSKIIFCGPCQRYLLQLWYSLPRAQERVYYVLAHAQDLAFESHRFSDLQAFVQLLGIVAGENAEYIARQFPSRPEPESRLDEDEHYMDAFELEMEQKRAIQSVLIERDKTLNEGLLSAFLPLLEYLLSNGHVASFSPPSALILSALISLGEFMKVSHPIAQSLFLCLKRASRLSTGLEYTPWLVDIIRDDSQPTSVRSACLDIWASILPFLHPSQVKTSSIHALHKHLEALDSVARKLLVTICRLVLKGQLRSDELRAVCFGFVADDPTMATTATTFFRTLFRVKGKETCERIYDLFFELEDVPAREVILRKLIKVAETVPIVLDALHVSLAKECEEQGRLEGASILLSLLAPTILGLTAILDALPRWANPRRLPVLMLGRIVLLHPSEAVQMRLQQYLAAGHPLVVRDTTLRDKAKSGLALLAGPGAVPASAPSEPQLEELISQAWLGLAGA